MTPTTRPSRDRHLVWIGALLTTAALITYFTLSVKLPSLRDSAWLNLAAMAAGLGLSIAAFVRRRSVWSAMGLTMSVLWTVALVGFVYGLSSRLPPAARAVEVGDTAPAFSLPDQTDHPVALSDFGGSNVVLVFYRGFW